MSDQLNEKLGRIACESLEQLAFMCPFPAEGDEIVDGPGAETVQLEFDGPFSGELFVVLDSCALPELACNMLGLDLGDEISVEEQRDALLESVNVICGNLLPEVAGAQAVFNLKAPQLLEPGSLEGVLAAREPTARVSLELDEGGLMLVLVLEEGWEKSVAAG